MTRKRSLQEADNFMENGDLNNFENLNENLDNNDDDTVSDGDDVSRFNKRVQSVVSLCDIIGFFNQILVRFQIGCFFKGHQKRKII